MSAPWFKIYSEELLSDPKIRLLDDDQLGRLLKLWAIANLDGCSIPANPKAIGKLLGIQKDNQMVSEMVWVRKFFAPSERDPERLVSVRLQKEQNAYEVKCEQLRKNGGKGGRPKKPNGYPSGYPDGLANGLANGYPDGIANEKQSAPEVGSRKEEKEVHTLRVCVPTFVATEQEPNEIKVKPKRKAREKQKTQEPSLEEILGGRESLTWERFWKTATVWNRDKIFAPKRLAQAWIEACAKEDPKTIYLAALHYRDEFLPAKRGKDETHFMKNPLEWLNEEGWSAHVGAIQEAANA